MRWYDGVVGCIRGKPFDRLSRGGLARPLKRVCKSTRAELVEALQAIG